MDLPTDRGGLLGVLAGKLEVARLEGSIVGLALVDTRHMHRINRIHGFAAGDAVLAHIAAILRQISRKDPVVRRVGGDEFGVVFSGIASPELLGLMGNKIARELGQCPIPGAGDISYDVNVGLAAFPVGAESAEDLYCRAEQALRLARARGQPFVVDDPAERPEEAQDWRLELEVLHALSHNALQLYAQPTLELVTDSPGRPEVLLRWTSAEQGGVPPSRLVPLIEQSGRSLELARWVLNTALRQSRRWGEIGVAVNLSASALGHAETAEMIASALRIWGVAPGRLSVEIAEAGLVRDVDASLRMLQPLSEAGVRIVLDDYGVGHSSLAQFAALPIDEVKLDRSLVAGILRNESSRVLCEHVVSLSHRLRRSVTAVGVEDQATLDLLRRLGVDGAQGYRIARPMSESDLQAWLQKSGGLAAHA